MSVQPLNDMIFFIPYILLLLRLLLGPAMLIGALRGVGGGPLAAGLTLGFVSDVLDGVIARRLDVADARHRAWDSQVDGVFCVFVLVSAWVYRPDTIRAWRIPLLAMIGAQGISLALDRWKYGRVSAYHAYSSKAAGVAQFAAIAGLFGFGATDSLWWIAIGTAILSHFERIAMTLVLPTWTHDVPSIFHAWRRK